VATWNDVRRIALALPETTEQTKWGTPTWCVADKGFVWERPLRKSDLEALGDRAPKGAILGVRVAHLLAKEALLAAKPDVYFTAPHFNGYPAVLVRLGKISATALRELITEAWLARAPKRLAAALSQTTRARPPRLRKSGTPASARSARTGRGRGRGGA
jgi:hypothetical protein